MMIQEFHGLTVNTPKGLLARVKDAQQCANDAANTGNCPSGSLIGHATVGAGVGSNPFFVNNGRVYLTGPYRGAPYGLAVVVDAIAGPFNLGTVVVRQAINIDPVTAQLSVVSDDFPTIQKGVPLHIRSVRVAIDKPRFMLAPTNCSVQQMGGIATAVDGATAALSSRFQVGDCGALNLTPKLAIGLTGKGQTTDNKHPGVHATVSQPAGQANLKKVAVSLPLSLALDPDNAKGCVSSPTGPRSTRRARRAASSARAVARTPILDQPLTGPVYFVKNVRKDPKTGREIRTLPKLVIPLTGQNGLRLNLVGTSDVVDDRLVTTFDNIPDAPVSDFTLDINGGKGGILVVSGTDICKATQIADQQIDGQNGKTADADVYLQTPACALKILSQEGRQDQRGDQGRRPRRRQGHRHRQGHQEDQQDHHQVHGRHDHRQAHQGQARQGHGLLRPDRPCEGPQDHQVAPGAIPGSWTTAATRVGVVSLEPSPEGATLDRLEQLLLE